MRYAFADCVLDTQLYTLARAGTTKSAAATATTRPGSVFIARTSCRIKSRTTRHPGTPGKPAPVQPACRPCDGRVEGRVRPGPAGGGPGAATPGPSGTRDLHFPRTVPVSRPASRDGPGRPVNDAAGDPGQIRPQGTGHCAESPVQASTRPHPKPPGYSATELSRWPAGTPDYLGGQVPGAPPSPGRTSPVSYP